MIIIFNIFYKNNSQYIKVKLIKIIFLIDIIIKDYEINSISNKIFKKNQLLQLTMIYDFRFLLN
jgi:hypothetical protein